jgi:hypothetical protein
MKSKILAIEPINWKDGLKIVLAVLTFGIGWFADNQVTVIAYIATIVVWLLGELAKHSDRFKWLTGKGPLTVLLFFISLGLAYLFQPFIFPPLPQWTGDAGSFVPLLSTWFSAIFAIIGNAVLFAMSVYNLLLAHVLEKLPESLSRWFQ